MESVVVEFLRLETPGHVEVLHCSIFSVETRKSGLGANPKLTIIVGQYSIHCVIGQPVGFLVNAFRTPVGDIESDEATRTGTKP